MSTPAIICDTGALLSYLDARSPDHAAYRGAVDSARARYVPGLVLAELDYFLSKDRGAMRSFVRDLQRRAFLYAPPTDGQLTRAMHIDQRHPRLGLGLVDATIVALAEELGIVRLATRDVRHFSVVRLGDGRAFDLLVVPKGAGPPRAARHSSGWSSSNRPHSFATREAREGLALSCTSPARARSASPRVPARRTSTRKTED